MHITTFPQAIIGLIVLLLAFITMLQEFFKRWWFLKESKKFMGYGDCMPKHKFWINFPLAAFRFYFYTSRDRIRILKSRAQARV